MRAGFYQCASAHNPRFGRLRLQTSAQTAVERSSRHCICLLSRPPQMRTVAVARLASAPSAHPCRCGEHGRSTRQQNCARAGAYRAQTTCALARPRASKQAPQSIAQWLLPFSHAAPPSASRTRFQASASLLFVSEFFEGLAVHLDKILVKENNLFPTGLLTTRSAVVWGGRRGGVPRGASAGGVWWWVVRREREDPHATRCPAPRRAGRGSGHSRPQRPCAGARG